MLVSSLLTLAAAASSLGADGWDLPDELLREELGAAAAMGVKMSGCLRVEG